MKYKQMAGFILFYLCAGTIFAHNNYFHHSRESRIKTAADLQHWCKSESYRHFRQKKLTPYNWTVITIRKLNDFHAKGSWTVNNQHFDISCRIRKGKKAKYAEIEISHEN